MGDTHKIIEKYNLKPGDKISVRKDSLGLVKHYAIYLGKSKEGIDYIAENNSSKGVIIISIDKFFSENIEIVDVTHIKRSGPTRRFIVESVLREVGKPYHLINFNSETFANKIHREIEEKLEKSKKGHLFFLSDFRGIGPEGAIKMALSRLAKEEKIKRIAHGIYLIPETDPLLGELLPSMERIAEAIAKKEHIRIKPAGAYALHKLGLTTQVPMKLVYLTNGPLRQIKIGKTVIKFKPTTPKKLALRGKLSSLIIQALEELGTRHLETDTIERIKELLKKENPRVLLADMKLAPAKISDFLFSLLKTE